MGIFKKADDKVELATLKEQLDKLLEEKTKKEIKETEAPKEISLEDDAEYDQEEEDDLNDDGIDEDDDVYTKMGKYLAAAINVYVSELSTDEDKKTA